MMTSLQPIPEGLIGREAFILFLRTLQPKNGSREIWFKLGHDRFYVGTWSDSGIFELWATKGKSENRRRTYKVSSDAFEFLYQQSLKLDGGVFYVPTQPQGFPLKNCVDSTDDITIEMDGIPLAEQWEKYQTFEAVTGLEFANLLASAGKSIHGRLKLTDHIPVDQAQEIRVLVTLGLISDPAILSLQQPVRVPGFFRKEKNSHQVLLKYSFKRYTPDQIRSGLKKWFAYQGWVFPETIPADWFREVLRPILAPTKDKPLTESQKVEQIKAALEKGFEEWKQEKLEKQRREALERQAKELERQSNPLSVVNTRHSEQVKETIREANRRLGSDAFNLFNHQWQWSGDKARGFCIGHESSTGTAAWMTLHANGEGYRYHCPTCTDNKPVTPFDYFVFSRTGAWERPKGAKFFELAAEFCRSAGIELPVRGNRQHHDSEYIQSQVEQERVEQAQQGATLLEHIQKKLFRHGKARKTRRLQPSVEAPQPQKRQVIRFGVEEIPDKATWQGPPPHVEFEPDERLAVVKAAKAKGWRFIVDQTPTGLGKSSDTAKWHPSDLGMSKIILFSEDHRNSTTIEAENWTDTPVRHDGMVQDDTRKTQGGKPHIRHPKAGESTNVQGNCINTWKFRRLASKGIDAEHKTVNLHTDEGSSALNPICASCRWVGDCAKENGKFRYERKIAFTQSRLKGHIDSFSASDITAGTVAIIDEHSRHLKPTIELQADLSDVTRIWADLELKLPQPHQELSPFRHELHRLLTVDHDRFGVSHPEFMERMGQAPANIGDILAAVEEVTPTAGDIVKPRDRVSVEGLSDEQLRRIKRLEQLTNEYHLVEAAYKQIELKHGLVSAAYSRKHGTPEERKLIRKWNEHYADGKILDLRAELKELKAKQQAVEEERKAARYAQSVLAGEQAKVEREMMENLPVYWLLPLLRIWAGGPGTVRIVNGKLIITTVNHRLRDTIQAFDLVLMLDATATPEQTARTIGVSPNDIITISQRAEKVQNLTVFQIRDVGLCNVKRSESLQERVAILKSAFRQKHPDGAIFDRMQADDRDGWWFNHTRGSNEFETVSAIASFGVPYQNLGALQDRYHALTGEWEGPEFTALVEELTHAEIVQAIGRLRARQRPNEQLTYYLFGDIDLPPELEAIQLTSADICPDAAPQGEKSRQAIIEAAKSLMEQGKKVTQQAVSDAVGKARSWIAEICKDTFGGWKSFLKIVGSLIDVSITISDKKSPNEYEQWIALEHLPAVTKDKPPEDIPKEIQEVISTVGWDSWVKVVAILPHETRIRLLAGVLNLLPRGWLMAQIDLLQVAL